MCYITLLVISCHWKYQNSAALANIMPLSDGFSGNRLWIENKLATSAAIEIHMSLVFISKHLSSNFIQLLSSLESNNLDIVL